MNLFETLRDLDVETAKTSLLYALLLYSPIIVFQNLLSPYLTLSDRWILTIFYLFVMFRRLRKMTELKP